jgi:hypothetical protein
MKNLSYIFFVAICCILLQNTAYATKNPPTTGRDSFLLLVNEIRAETEKIQHEYALQIAQIQQTMDENNRLLTYKEVKGEYDAAYLQALSLKIQLLEEKEKVENAGQFNVTKTRYKKGVELIKMVYEKVLALDHHFAALQTYQNIATMTNPNSYPEFQNAKAILDKKANKSSNPLQLPAILATNPYVAVANTIANFVVSSAGNKEKDEEIEKIACIMDFTVRMNADLSIINHETGFLRSTNQSLKEESAVLFDEYVKVIGYTTPIDRCRKADDWDKVYEMLDLYVADMEAQLKKAPTDKSVYKKQVNLEFSIERLLDYINKYSAFVSQGEKYYQKFKGIVGNYENQAKCAEKLPKQFGDLQKDIDISIEKFNTSYSISELKGSKLKDLLYGSSLEN